MPFRRLFRLAARDPSVGPEVDQEIASHLEQVTEWLVSRGWKLDAARDEARRRFGDVDRFKHEIGAIDRSAVRRRRLGERVDSVRQDVVLAWRGLRRSPSYAVVVVGTLGLALGANATMFGVVDRLLLQPPPGIVAPDLVKRVEMARWIDNGHSEAWDAISYPSFEGLRDHTTAFSAVAAMTASTLSLGVGSEARPTAAIFASGQFFQLTGAAPYRGRLFGEQDDAGDGAAVAVLSFRFWQTAFAGDPTVVGRSLVLNGKPFQVVGITGPRFNGTELATVDLWLPLSTVGGLVQGRDSQWRTGKGWQWLNGLVRKKPGVTDEQASADATRAYQLANADFAEFESKAAARFRSLQAYSEDAGPERVAGWLYGVTLIVLLIACANIANVVLARGIVRRTETAVRRALGIPRGRLLRQLAVETALVMGLGLVVGLAITRWGGALVRKLLAASTAWDSDPINVRVFLTTVTAAVVAAILATLWPLVRSARVDLAAELHGANRTVGRLGGRARGGLLLAQTTLCTALIVMAGLFLRSMATIRSLDLGIRPNDAYLVSIDVQGQDWSDGELQRFYYDATDRIRRIPGVVAAGVIVGAPFRSNSSRSIQVPGKDTLPSLRDGGKYYFGIGPGTLEALGVRLLQGRSIQESDRSGAAPVVIVSERMARTIWPGESAVGKCFHVDSDSLPCREVVGVTANLNRQELEEHPFYQFFTVVDQEPTPVVPHHVVVRTAPGAELGEAFRQAFAGGRSDLPYVEIDSYRDILARHSRQWNLGASLLTVFGGLSLLIAAIGLSGVIGFGVSQRSREIGVRTALGATPRRILWSVVAGGVGTAAAGVLLGLALALAAGGRLQSLLFRTSPSDPWVLAAAATIVVVVSGVAAWLPGRKALRVDPMSALRAE
jgi:predicted permease